MDLLFDLMTFGWTSKLQAGFVAAILREIFHLIKID